MALRLRLAALMREHGYQTAYQLAQAVDRRRVSEATIYRLVRDHGRIDRVRASTLEALATVFDCDVADLFERGKR